MPTSVMMQTSSKAVSNLIELIRVAVGRQTQLSHQLTDVEWTELYAEVEKQALIGVCFAGIEALSNGQLPSMDLLMDWLGQAEYLRMQYDMQEEALVKVVQKLEAEGLEYRVLKGLGLARWYHADANPKLTPNLRSMGDFDIWINGSKLQVLDFAAKYGKVGDVVYHHVDAGRIDGVEVELHFHPSSLKNVKANERMQRWFDRHFSDPDSLKVGGKEVHVSSLVFNRIYVLNHIYRHLLYEGVGLRQFLDYYFVLQESCRQAGSHWEKEKQESLRLIREFEMEHFSNAITWVLLQVFEPEALKKGVVPEWVLGEPDEARGRLLLDEMLKGGNFGMHDRDKKYYLSDPWVKRYMNRIRYDLKFLWQYPEEVMWCPVWFIWERWQKWMGRW